jgi:hypothetical protein
MRVSKRDAISEGGLICLKLLRAYERIAPDDSLPFRVVAKTMTAIIDGKDDQTHDSVAELHERRLALATPIQELGIKRGLLVAAAAAIDAVDALGGMLHPESVNDYQPALDAVRRCLANANEAVSEIP